MKHAALIGPRTFALKDRAAPQPGPGQAVVRIRATGVCASELSPWRDGHPHLPRLLGHEPAGEVQAVGPGVKHVAPGARVAGLFGNAFGDLAVADADRLVPIPDGVPFHAALGEPLACVVNAFRRTQIDLGASVGIVGLGFMGLLALQVARLRGPAHVVAIDVREDVRDIALRLGADEAFHPDEVPPRYMSAAIEDTPNLGLDVVIEAAGVQAALTLSSQLVRQHGVLSIVGYHEGGERSLDIELWNWKAITVINGHVRRLPDKLESLRIGLELLGSGAVTIEPLITHRYPLTSINEAFRALQEKPPGFIKAVIEP